MSEENVKNKYVTEEHLDKRLTENNQLFLNAMDSILAKRLTKTKEDLRYLTLFIPRTGNLCWQADVV